MMSSSVFWFGRPCEVKFGYLGFVCALAVALSNFMCIHKSLVSPDFGALIFYSPCSCACACRYADKC